MRCVRGVLKTPKHEIFCPRYCPQAPRMAAHMVPNFLVNIILIHSTIYLEGCLSICCCLIFICCCLSVYLLLSDIYLLMSVCLFICCCLIFICCCCLSVYLLLSDIYLFLSVCLFVAV